MNKKTVAVLFGAVSSEYEVSLRSAASVLRNFPIDQYTPLMLGITKDGRWLEYTGPIDAIENDSWQQIGPVSPALISPDRSHGGLLRLTKTADGHIEASPLSIDLVFPVMHGEHAEDGTLQGLLEIAGIPYVGCGVLSSAACMDKEVSHTLLEGAGIAMTPWAVCRRWDMDAFDTLAAEWEAILAYPMFVKPANTGSSVGVSKVKNRDELKAALLAAFPYDNKVLIEKTAVGKELECAVLGNLIDSQASVVGEIVPHHDFYDYEGKYLDDSTDLYIPARISSDDSEQIRKLARDAFRAMGCCGLARVDFFLCDDGKILLNEINTIPGFTSISMYPKLFDAAGIPYPALIARLLSIAAEKE